MTETVDT